MKPRKLKKYIESKLTAESRTQLFKRLRFKINGRTANSKGWINDIKGPPSLGEDKSDHFVVNLNTGAVCDRGSTGGTGDLWSCIGDVCGCGFRGALEWAADELNIQPPNTYVIFILPGCKSEPFTHSGSFSVTVNGIK